MAPFNMRCTTCGEYIYRGKKFNAKKEDVIGKTYLGIQVYRFYIKCTKCLAEITFLVNFKHLNFEFSNHSNNFKFCFLKTDPENQDYAMEFGAIRNFESVRLAEIQAEKEAKKEKEEEENNPMKILENRTRDSRREMAALETLEDLRELNAAHATVDPKVLIEEEAERKRKLEEQQIEEDEEEIRRIFGKKRTNDNGVGHQEAIEQTQEEDEEEEEVLDEAVTSKKLKTEPTIVIKSNILIILSSKDEYFKVKSNSECIKEVKKEAEEAKLDQPKTSSSVLFKKPALPVQTNSKSMDVKSKISSLIKKKPESETAKAPVSAAPRPAAVNPLASLASYSSSDESDNDEN